MNKTREERLRNDQKYTYKSRLQVLSTLLQAMFSDDDILSPLEVMIYIPEVYRKMDAKELDPNDLEHTVRNVIPPYLDKRGKNNFNLMGRLIRSKIDLPDSADPFPLAIATLVTCAKCSTTLPLHFALKHQCIRYKHKKPTDMSDILFECIVDDLSTYSILDWSADNFGNEIMRNSELINSLGLDVKTTTVEQLDRSELRIQCAGHLDEHYIPIFTWRGAVCYSLEWVIIPYLLFTQMAHQNCPTKHFKLATEDQITAAKPLEPTVYEQMLHKADEQHTFRCSHCAGCRSVQKAIVMRHLRDM
jgi:hypothetical protein